MLTQLRRTLPLFAAGLAGGALAMLAGLPMPFMLGGLTGAGLAVAALERRGPTGNLRVPAPVRLSFVAIVGTMIGAGFTPDLAAAMPAFWPSALAVLVFIAVAHAGGYVIMRRVGGYPRVDALYAAMPGGLVEAAILGEKAGADPRVLTVQHFIRVILVVVAVPLLFLVTTGEVVGSAAGQALGPQAAGARDLALILAIAPVGLALGRLARMPAWHLMGPIILSAALHLGGWVAVTPPGWLLHTAQWVIGVGLGAQFSGIRPETLVRGLGTGVVAVAYMLAVSYGFALGLARIVPADVPALFLAFAPGGVAEMNLIALSLSLSPVIVAAHHLIRIVATVFMTNAAARRLALRA